MFDLKIFILRFKKKKEPLTVQKGLTQVMEKEI